MVIDYFLGLITGGMLGFLIAGLQFHLKTHKSNILESLSIIRNDINYFRIKLDNVVEKLPKA